MCNCVIVYRKIILSISLMALLLLNTPTDMQLLSKSVALGVIIAIFIFKSKFVLECNNKINSTYWIIAFVFSIANGFDCYNTWIGSKKLSSMLSVGSSIYPMFLGIIVGVITLLTVPMVVTIFSYYIEIGKGIFSELCMSDTVKSNKWSIKRSILFLSVIYMLGISAIVRANYSYKADLGRAALGYKGWGNYRRILSNVLSTVIHMDNYLTDVSPLSQLISAIIIAFSGVVLLAVIYERIHYSIMELLSIVPLFLNPYFLECISYKFDSPYMALSVFGSIFPLIYRNRKGSTYIGISILGTLIMCTTYQASSGIYPMLVILLALRMWSRKEDCKRIVRFCVDSIIGYCVGILIYKFFIMTSTNEGAYVSNSLPKIKDFIPNFCNNLIQYYDMRVKRYHFYNTL
jgi:hypothetical protein